LSYLTGAIWCAKFAGADGPFVTVRTAIAVFTVVAIAGIGLVGWSGFRHHRRGAEPAPHDADSPEDRDRFVGLATLLLAALSAVATVYSALAAVFIESCY